MQQMLQQMLSSGNPLQFMEFLANMGNPMSMMQQMLGNNPMFKQAMQMVQGKNPQEIQSMLKNVAQQKGISDNQLNSMLNNCKQVASKFGVKF